MANGLTDADLASRTSDMRSQVRQAYENQLGVNLQGQGSHQRATSPEGTARGGFPSQEGNAPGAEAPQPDDPGGLLDLGDGTQVDLASAGYEPEIIERIRSGFLRQRDYTQKTQSLKSEREQLEMVRAQVVDLARDAQQWRHLESQLEANPRLAEEMTAVIQRLQSGQTSVPPPPGYNPEDEGAEAMGNYVGEVARRAVAPLEAQLTSLTRQLSRQTELGALIAREPGARGLEAEISSRMDQTPGLTAEEAFRLITYGQQVQAAKNGDQIARANAQRASSLHVPGGAAPGSPVQVDVTDRDKFRTEADVWNWIRQQAKNGFRQNQLRA